MKYLDYLNNACEENVCQLLTLFKAPLLFKWLTKSEWSTAPSQPPSFSAASDEEYRLHQEECRETLTSLAKASVLCGSDIDSQCMIVTAIHKLKCVNAGQIANFVHR